MPIDGISRRAEKTAENGPLHLFYQLIDKQVKQHIARYMILYKKLFNINYTHIKMESTSQNLKIISILDIIQFSFSMALTSSVIAFCMYKLITAASGSPDTTTYFSPMMALVVIWIPIKNIKSNLSKKIAAKLANVDVENAQGIDIVDDTSD